MSHTFDCVIDTHEMAQTLHSVQGHVDGTTGAVVAMQSAVIAAEKKGADLVCKRVNQGFYAMVHSQISQKMARLQSRVDAQIMRLNQQRKQLESIRRVMERDYQMISQRYLKLFNTLNRELRQRVTELDRPIMNFASAETDKMTNRNDQTVSIVPVGQAEAVKAANKLIASRLKNNAARAISTIERFIVAANNLNAITGHILLRRHADADSQQIVVPAIILESNFDASNHNQTYVYVSSVTEASASARNEIEQSLYEVSRSGDLKWKECSEKPAELENRFREYVANSGLADRTKQMINAMFDSHSFQSL